MYIKMIPKNAMLRMIDDDYNWGDELVKGLNLLYDLATEYGFVDDDRYKEASDRITDSFVYFEYTCANRVIDIHEWYKVYEILEQHPVGKYLVEKAIKKIES